MTQSASFVKLLEIACYYQNRCCDQDEIIEMFCRDAAAAQGNQAAPTRPMTQPQIDAMTNNMGIYDGDYETAIVRAVEKHYEIKGTTK